MRRVSRSLIVVLICLPTLAVAQAGKESDPTTKPRTSAPISSTPERTTASFGNWIMRCEIIGTPAKRICEAAHIITPQGQNNPIAQVAIGKTAPGDGKQLTLVLPTNVALTNQSQITVANAAFAPIELVWQRCMPGGCFASASIADSALAALGAQTEPGRILFKDASGRDIALPLEFRGLAQALEALSKEP